MTITVRRSVLAVVAVLAVAGIAGGVTVAATANEAPTSQRNEWGHVLGVEGVDEDAAEVVGDTSDTDRFVLFGQDTQFTFVDEDPGGPSVGDTFIFKQAVYTHGGANRVGSLYVECVFQFSEIAECEGTMALAGRGKLTFTGTVPPKRQFVLAVTGGTGEFIGRNGEVVVEDFARVDRFTFYLTK